MVRWLFFIVIVFFIDLYAFQSVKTITKHKIVFVLYWLISIAVIVNVIYSVNSIEASKGLNQQVMLSFGLLILTIAPKIIALIVLFSEDIFRIFKSVFNYFSTTAGYFPDRRVFVSKVALGLAAIPFSSILYGMVKGKYNFKVIKHTLFFDDLPSAFDGFKLTHLSDIHSGSFDNEEKIAYAIDLINEQESDVILFTGDIVNNIADEMNPWIPYFKKIKAKDGKYSVLGNHDYGEYVRWNSAEEKEQNFQAIKDIHPKIGFNLLLNDSVYLEKENDKIALIGVENWGTRFKKAGDLNLASSKINKEDFKILMSHDPSHWEHEVKTHEKNYHLTLSGHTHGMQFGIEIPGVKWSPIKYVYKHWAGMYKELGKYINVNRGFGFLAFPGRIGIWPEITVITLKKK
ncbi:metallophosphoesterase [Lutibacter sp. A64]|uniref:metallophosphoesterase n=1 Tax=Lutibacter sp. A64 TaxID=2918526 RepID=UPI001F060C28|nr:metallophosphoesterase [Lutibacter sp. A64]UMB53431.1 metallophosphoesterase [Lutibacter sp. A64]